MGLNKRPANRIITETERLIIIDPLLTIRYKNLMLVAYANQAKLPQYFNVTGKDEYYVKYFSDST